MTQNDWTKKIVLKYAAFQIPSFLIVLTILLTLNHFYHLGSLTILIILILWIFKDFFMFPIVWRSYETRSHRLNWQSKIRDAQGIVVEDLDPVGYIRLNGELWKARSAQDDIKITKDEKVVVSSIEKKMLVVKRPSG